ncbi:hypothetical protein BD410DRAFT_795240 [Rickenella mellea]|uniref:DUF6534 domain-containing protein n=1 Tax=Rickenella mellea TaxID=50990 RepID=A0A4Y7PN15_9AGAM|nr:hypothetical protein BD410DRAFT_795240 [Rickenella mellea]
MTTVRPHNHSLTSSTSFTGDMSGQLCMVSIGFKHCPNQTSLLGVSVRKGYFYFSKYHDRLALKVYVREFFPIGDRVAAAPSIANLFKVAFLLFLDMCSTLVWGIGLHGSLIRSRGKPVSVTSAIPFLAAGSAMTLTITFASQLFFSRRVYLLDSSRLRISVIVTISALLALGGGITRIIVMLAPPPDATAQGIFNITNTFENGFAAVSDIVATIAMCFKFVETAMDTRRWDPSAIKTTSDWLLKYVCFRMTSLLRRLMIYTVNRGIVVTSVQILTLVLYWHAPDKLYWMTFHMCVGKLYVNTLLAMLNARRQLRSISEYIDHSERNEKPSTLVVHAIAHSANEMKASM